MNFLKGSCRLQLQDHLLLDNEIEPLYSQVGILEVDVDFLLSLKRDSPVFKRHLHGPLVDRLDKARPERFMHLDRRPQNSAGDLLKRIPHRDPLSVFFVISSFRVFVIAFSLNPHAAAPAPAAPR